VITGKEETIHRPRIARLICTIIGADSGSLMVAVSNLGTWAGFD
jgi:hypothetical protein